jgi:transcription elongation GreA/GreB family factor
MMPDHAFKQKLFAKCLEILDGKISALQSALKELTEGAQNDSKSSAGDKHETSRAMMQIEQENISRQLDELLRERNELALVDISSSSVVKKGSLIKTNHGYLFLSVAIGKVITDSNDVIVLSPQSPLGRKLTGLTAGSSAEVNGVQYRIDEID